jgi:diacylglycerol O-acyltransferase / wax synthase
MRQLSPLDAMFLNIESRSMVGHVGGLAIFDPSDLPSGRISVDDVRSLIEERLHLLPPFRWRLVEMPLGLDYPYWIEAPEFDLEFHVREIALPAPGSDRQLAEQVGRIVARPLDRSRPLWELYVIDGLESGNVAWLSKIHHAAVDGMSGAEILGTLMDTSPEGPQVSGPPKDWKPERAPAQLELLPRALLGMAAQPVRALRGTPRTLPNLSELPGASSVPGVGAVAELARRAARLAGIGAEEGSVIERPRVSAPRISLNGAVTPHRRFAFTSLPLDDVKAVKGAFGATVNDVVMAICAAALRRWLIDHDELPDDPLLTAVPVSVRTPEQIGTYGNRVSVIIAPLPTHLPDPLGRLEAVHEAMRSAKERHQALPASLMQDYTQFIPSALAARASRAALRLAASQRVVPIYNVLISNVPGPQHPLYSAGARLVANYPVSAVSDGAGLNITVLSYCGHLDFGLIACREMVPDLWNLAAFLAEALEELKALMPEGAVKEDG